NTQITNRKPSGSGFRFERRGSGVSEFTPNRWKRTIQSLPRRGCAPLRSLRSPTDVCTYPKVLG
ncbi:MAG TPA: hypothetical protein H9900_01325, partial [Candidatus Monoglobus merdigallinarum]|nr:hypothetical protein [Candidatus Monoglobus merdigallinarum]